MNAAAQLCLSGKWQARGSEPRARPAPPRAKRESACKATSLRGVEMQTHRGAFPSCTASTPAIRARQAKREREKMHGIRATRHTKTTRQWPGNSQAKKANRLDNAKSMRESSLPSQISASRYRSTTFRWTRVYLHSWSFLPRHERLNLPAQLRLLLLLLLLVFLVQLDCSLYCSTCGLSKHRYFGHTPTGHDSLTFCRFDHHRHGSCQVAASRFDGLS